MAGMVLAYGTVQAQITPEVVYQGNGQMIKLSNGDVKYQLKRSLANQVTLYNLNHSIYKQFTPPLLSGSQASISYISDALFDTNPATIEYLAKYYDSNNGTPLKSIVYSETGNQIAVFDSAYDTFIYNTPVGAKMLVNKGNPNPNGPVKEYTRVYSLPGQLALRAATAQSAEVVGASPNPAHELITLHYAVPQGENGTLRVYNLSGQLIASYKVDDHVGGLEMGAQDLRPGIYVFNVTTKAGTTAGKRFVIE